MLGKHSCIHKKLGDSRLSTHDVIIMRGGKIIYEAYRNPFNRDFQHSMYSITKSFAAIAIGFLEQEGKLSLDDKIIKCFPDELRNQPDENLRNQTIRHMLMMSTARQREAGFQQEQRIGCVFRAHGFGHAPFFIT